MRKAWAVLLNCAVMTLTTIGASYAQPDSQPLTPDDSIDDVLSSVGVLGFAYLFNPEERQPPPYLVISEILKGSAAELADLRKRGSS